MFTAREVTEDREKLWRVGTSVKIILFPARQFRIVRGNVRSQLCEALWIVFGNVCQNNSITCAAIQKVQRHCAQHCVRQCALTIVWGIVNCVRQCSMVWYGRKEEVIWKEGGYGLITGDERTDKGRYRAARAAKNGPKQVSQKVSSLQILIWDLGLMMIMRGWPLSRNLGENFVI